MAPRARTATTLAALAALPLLLVGCATGDRPAEQHSAVGSLHRMPDGTLMDDAEMATGDSPAVASPSSSAAMICAPETHEALQHNLGLSDLPTSTDRWADGIYTCTYHLAGGDLTASVQDATDQTAGQRYFDTVRADIPGLHRIDGLQSFGLPGYADNRGIVLFLKDGKTLQIDATALPASVGSYNQSQADVAYGLAASILACWSEH